MYLTAHKITYCLHLIISFTVGYSMQMTEQDTSFVLDEVFKNLLTTSCDMIVVSSSPFPGDVLLMPLVQAQ